MRAFVFWAARVMGTWGKVALSGDKAFTKPGQDSRSAKATYSHLLSLLY